MTGPPHEPGLCGTWTCRGCPNAWPCPTAREQLLAEYEDATAALGAYLGHCLSQATIDLPYADPAVLYTRFLGWLPGVDPETTRARARGAAR